MTDQMPLDAFNLQTSATDGGSYNEYYYDDGQGGFQLLKSKHDHYAVDDGLYAVEILGISAPFEMTYEGNVSTKVRLEVRVTYSRNQDDIGAVTSILVTAAKLTPGNTIGRIKTAATGTPPDGSPYHILDLIGKEFGVPLKYTKGNPNPNKPGQNYPDRNAISDYKKIVPADEAEQRRGGPPRRPSIPQADEGGEVPF